ncbi:Transcriptional activator NphR [Nocardiopsis dassonvillei]|uniref:helix-turn-helix domain-containing protein n=1 Tax=Nocardiopsis dassonvillei TaxID=2014 RepID=UPI003F575CC0
MNVFEFDTDDLPTTERFDAWRHHMARAPTPMDATSDRVADFRVYQRDLHLDTVRVWKMGFRALTVRRTPRLIRCSDPEAYNICLLQSGSLNCGSDGRQETCGPDDIHVNDSSSPFDLQAPGGGEPVTLVGVEIPKKLLFLPRRQADRMAGLRLPGHEGIGALLGGFLTRLTETPEAFSDSDGPRLALTLSDLVSALFAHTLEAGNALVTESRGRTLSLRIRAFIHEHLHEPELTPGAVAAAHHISVGYLHRLFQEDDVTVSAWIREQRLERARRDLADPALSAVPIRLIAERWGFSHPAVFSRAFRAAHGIAPRDYRRRCHDQEGA